MRKTMRQLLAESAAKDERFKVIVDGKNARDLAVRAVEFIRDGLHNVDNGYLAPELKKSTLDARLRDAITALAHARMLLR